MTSHSHSASGFDLDASLDHLAHWLPSQGPIKDFIHHNTLHAFQHLPFHDGISVASKLFGARSYLPMADYQKLFQQGRITPAALDWSIAQHNAGENSAALRESLFIEDKHSHYPPLSLANHGIRSAWMTHLETDLNALVHPVLFRLLSNFLDQGISRWALPKNGERFWDCVLRLAQNSLLPLYPFHIAAVRPLLKLTPDQVIASCLQQMVGDEALYEQYLLEVLLSHPGWSGMVRIVETQPNALLARRLISLKEMLAVELICELAFVHKRKGEQFLSIAQLPNLQQLPLLNGEVLTPKVPLKLKIWHEAMEWALHTELLAAIVSPTPAKAEKTSPQAQALFCIDDRECSLRRYLEAAHPSIETFGAAGFFGIDFLYQGLDDAYPVAQCPAVITPKHLVTEHDDHPPVAKKPQNEQLSKLHFNAHSLWRGWLYTQTLGLGYAVRMAWNVFNPTSQIPGVKTLSEVEAHSHLHLLRESDEPTADGHLLGFSLTEMADKIGGLLRNIGLTHDFAPLVVVVAHGSSSVNNPHFAAYDCGACSGKPGAPNARAFAWMANHAGVREILRERGIDIPDGTQFVPALHNTSRDEISYFDQTGEESYQLSEFKTAMQHALQRNARERCRWFELGPQSHSNQEAHQHVLARSSSIFEPRPELNHSNNLYCIIGRRELTRHLFMDRRAFLHSYHPDTDADGEILSKILSAVIPVCGGINLEYLFSRIDNSVYGAGTKLPHNVIGLLGVANGVEGDLRTGLPSQMIEVHEPARLLIVIEQSRTLIDGAISKIGGLKEWLDNDWIRLASCEPNHHGLFLYRKTGWEVIEIPNDLSVPSGKQSESIIVGKTTTIPVHQLTGGHA